MMRKLILILLPCALLVGQQKKASKKKQATDRQQSSVSQSAPTAQPAAAAAPPPSSNAPPLTIPPGAKEVEPYLFAFTDTQGKKWFYRQTPFGVVKWEDKPAAAPVIDNTNPVIITDLGDSVRFMWKTPFGDQTWVRKKSELNDDEKAMIQREQNKRPSPDPLAGTAGSARKTAEKE